MMKCKILTQNFMNIQSNSFRQRQGGVLGVGALAPAPRTQHPKPLLDGRHNSGSQFQLGSLLVLVDHLLKSILICWKLDKLRSTSIHAIQNLKALKPGNAGAYAKLLTPW